MPAEDIRAISRRENEAATQRSLPPGYKPTVRRAKVTPNKITKTLREKVLDGFDDVTETVSPSHP